MARDYVANQSKDNNKISHRIICSGYYNPHIKGANIYYLKGQIRGKLLLQCVTLYLSNILVNALSVTIYYNSLQSVNQQVEMVRLEGLEPSRAYAHHPLKMAWHLINIYKLNEYSIYQLLYNIYNYIF